MTKKPQIQYDMQFELILIGDSGVGKSCMLLRYSDDMFQMTFIATVGKHDLSASARTTIIITINFNISLK